MVSAQRPSVAPAPGIGVRPSHVLCALVLVACLAAPIRSETLPLSPTLQSIYGGVPPRSVAAIQAMDVHQRKLAEFLRQRTVGIMVAGSQGSGVIVSPDGYVLTAAHVCVQAKQRCVVVLPDGRRVWARTLGLNRARDAGLVKINEPVTFLESDAVGTPGRKAPERDAPGGDASEGSDTPGDKDKRSAAADDASSTEAAKSSHRWPYVEMAPAGAVRQGMWCVATGHPGGYERDRLPVVRVGRVLFVSQSIVRTDCVLVGGDSGGPLCDMEGRVIGIHSRIGGQLNMNLHVPIGEFHKSWDRLVRGDDWGRATKPASPRGRPMIGVREDRDSNEAKIGEVIPGMPAASAGIEVGDVIVKFNGEPVPDFDALVELVGKTRPGQMVVVELRRDGQTIQLKLTVGKAPQE